MIDQVHRERGDKAPELPLVRLRVRARALLPCRTAERGFPAGAGMA